MAFSQANSSYFQIQRSIFYDRHLNGLSELAQWHSWKSDCFANTFVFDGDTDKYLMESFGESMERKSSFAKLEKVTKKLSDLKISSKSEYWRPSSCIRKSKREEPIEDVTHVVTDRSRSTSRPGSLNYCDKNSNTTPVLFDKFDNEKPTAESELAAKTIIENHADFKLLFATGHEVEQPDAYYDDPIPVCLGAGFDGNELVDVEDDAFLQRMLVIGRLHKETVCAEERQQKMESILKASSRGQSLVAQQQKAKYNSERKHTNDQDECTRDIAGARGKHERSRTREITKNAREDGRETCKENQSKDGNNNNDKNNNSDKATINMGKQSSVGGKKSTKKSKASSSSTSEKNGSTRNIYDGRCDAVQYNTRNFDINDNKTNDDSLKETTAVSQASLGSELKTCHASLKSTQNRKILRKKRTKNSNGLSLKPTRYYAITDIVAMHPIPCAEKLSIDRRHSARRSLSPGKSFHSQRRYSLTTKCNSGSINRPATATKKKLSTHTKPSRPKTAVPDIRTRVKAV
eukprot:gene19147-21066_t